MAVMTKTKEPTNQKQDESDLVLFRGWSKLAPAMISFTLMISWTFLWTPVPLSLRLGAHVAMFFVAYLCCALFMHRTINKNKDYTSSALKHIDTVPVGLLEACEFATRHTSVEWLPGVLHQTAECEGKAIGVGWHRIGRITTNPDDATPIYVCVVRITEQEGTENWVFLQYYSPLNAHLTLATAAHTVDHAIPGMRVAYDVTADPGELLVLHRSHLADAKPAPNWDPVQAIKADHQERVWYPTVAEAVRDWWKWVIKKQRVVG